MSGPGPERFGFVQLQLAGAIGVDDGRYLARARSGGSERVLIVRTENSPPRPSRRFRRARPRPVKGDARTRPVPLTTLTLVRTEPLGDLETAGRWLAALGDDVDGLQAEVDGAVVQANRALHAHRSAALDPNVADVTPDHALAIRIGFGTGDGLVDGRWEQAVEIPASPRPGRGETLRPQERVAAVLGGREEVAACEALLLRARADLDAERNREAALQLRVGLEALLVELAGAETLSAADPEGKQIADLAELEERRRITGEAANEALGAELSSERTAEVTETLRICERVLRRRRVTPD